MDQNWKKKINQFNLDPTLKWELAEITQLDNSKIYFNLLSNEDKHKSGLILLNDLRWTISKNKSIKNKFKIGDIIFVKKNKNLWSLKQYPKVNGGIVVIDPYNGDVKALVGGFDFKSSEFNRVTQAKRQPGSAFKPIVYAAILKMVLRQTQLYLMHHLLKVKGLDLRIGKPENYGKVLWAFNFEKRNRVL